MGLDFYSAYKNWNIIKERNDEEEKAMRVTI